jgi:hypothetical protein
MASGGHAQPAGECLCCFGELDDTNYVEFRVSETAAWTPAKYCGDCIQTLLDSKFEAYMTGVAKSTCEAELRRYMVKGPPLYLEDPLGLPCAEGESAYELWYCSDNSVRSGKVKGALEGDERQKLWDEHKSFVTKFREAAQDDTTE